MSSEMIQHTIVVLVSTIPMMYFINKVLKVNKIWFSTVLGTIFATMVNYLFTYIFVKYQLVTTAMTILYFIVYAFVFSKESIGKKILCVALAFVGQFLGEMIGYIVWSAMAGKSITAEIVNTKEYYWITYIVGFIITVIYIGLYYLFYIIWRKVISKTKERTLGYFVLFPLSQGVFVWFIVSYALSNKAESTIFIIILTLSIISVIADAILFKTINSLNQKHLVEQKNLLMEQELNRGWNYYNNLILNYEGVNKIRHDIRNQIMTINALIDKKEIKKAQNQITDLENKVYKTENEICKNHIVASVLEEKIKICSEEKIKINYDITIPNNINIKGIDLCSLYANIMDNAINASKKCKKKEINITTKIEKGYIIINEDNYYEETTKKKKTNKVLQKHGLGLEIINDIVKKYDGNIKIKDTFDKFKITILIRLN